MNSKQQVTYKGLFRPWPIRLLNAIARSLKPISGKSGSLEVRDLLARASRRTGLENWGQPGARQALDVSLESVQREGQLSYFGRFALGQFWMDYNHEGLKLGLASRAKVATDQKEHRDRHPYKLSQFGLEADTVNQRFVDDISAYELESKLEN